MLNKLKVFYFCKLILKKLRQYKIYYSRSYQAIVTYIYVYMLVKIKLNSLKKLLLVSNNEKWFFILILLPSGNIKTFFYVILISWVK